MTITITNILNPSYANAEGTAINCSLVTVEYGTIPFSATSYDPEAHGREIFADLQSGKYGAIAPFVGG